MTTKAPSSAVTPGATLIRAYATLSAPLLLPYTLLSFIYRQFPLALYHPVIQYEEFRNAFQPALLFVN